LSSGRVSSDVSSNADEEKGEKIKFLPFNRLKLKLKEIIPDA